MSHRLRRVAKWKATTATGTTTDRYDVAFHWRELVDRQRPSKRAAYLARITAEVDAEVNLIMSKLKLAIPISISSSTSTLRFKDTTTENKEQFNLLGAAMILEEPPRRGGPWPSHIVPDCQLFTQPLREYQAAIASPCASPLFL
jgi:hypothetical protein